MEAHFAETRKTDEKLGMIKIEILLTSSEKKNLTYFLIQML